MNNVFHKNELEQDACRKCSAWSSSKIVNVCRTESCHTKKWARILPEVNWFHQMWSSYIVRRRATSRDVFLLLTNQRFSVGGGWVVHIEFSVQLCPTLNNIKLITNIRIHADFSKYFEHVKCLDFLG